MVKLAAAEMGESLYLKTIKVTGGVEIKMVFNCYLREKLIRFLEDNDLVKYCPLIKTLYPGKRNTLQTQCKIY